jgi:hypothetical protein
MVGGAPAPARLLIRWWYEFWALWPGWRTSRRSTAAWIDCYLAAIVVHALRVAAWTLRAAGALEEARSDRHRKCAAPWYRREAQRLAREGWYPEAMQSDFLGLVLELDQRGVLKFHPSKTPNEYTHEVGGAEPVRTAFRDLVRTLYRFAFAGQPCGPDDFALWHERSVAGRYSAAH